MREAGWPLPEAMNGLRPIEPDGDTRFRLPRLGIHVVLPGWRMADREESGSGEYRTFSQYMLRDINGPIQLCVTETCFPRELGAFGMEGDVDDARMYDHAISLARQYGDNLRRAARRGVEVTAIHLLFFGEQSQFAMSYDLIDSNLGRLASRKYPIVIRDPASQRVYEVVFTFITYGDSARLNALSPFLDHVVTHSLASISAGEPAKTLKSHLRNSPILTSTLPVCLDPVPRSYNVRTHASPPRGCAATLASVGAVLVIGYLTNMFEFVCVLLGGY